MPQQTHHHCHHKTPSLTLTLFAVTPCLSPEEPKSGERKRGRFLHPNMKSVSSPGSQEPGVSLSSFKSLSVLSLGYFFKQLLLPPPENSLWLALFLTFPHSSQSPPLCLCISLFLAFFVFRSFHPSGAFVYVCSSEMSYWTGFSLLLVSPPLFLYLSVPVLSPPPSVCLYFTISLVFLSLFLPFSVFLSLPLPLPLSLCDHCAVCS